MSTNANGTGPILLPDSTVEQAENPKRGKSLPRGASDFSNNKPVRDGIWNNGNQEEGTLV